MKYTKKELKEFAYIPDAFLMEVDNTYIGGMLFWLYDGYNLRTLYIVDVSYGWFRTWHALEVHVTYGNLDVCGEGFIEDELIFSRGRAYRLETVEEFIELIETSKPEMYHVTNVAYANPCGWMWLRSGKFYDSTIHRFSKAEILDCLIVTDRVAEIVGFIVEKTKTKEEITEFIEVNNLKNKMWFMPADLSFIQTW